LSCRRVLGEGRIDTSDNAPPADNARGGGLRDSERTFRLLVQSVTDYAIFLLDPDGTVATWNEGAARIKGYRESEILGENFSVFYTPEDRASGAPAAALRRAREQGRFESEGWRVRKDGERFWALAVIDAVRDESGALLGFAKITRDMTERRDAQLKLQRAQEQLAQAQKLEAIGQLTGGVAHDFNNLLMIVTGQAQLMRLRAKDPRDVRALDAIEQAASSGANLTRQLLTFARRRPVSSVVIDLAEKLEAFRNLLTSSLGASVTLDLDVASDLWPVEADVSELELALVNIAINAREAMPKGGVLRIKARNVSIGYGGPDSMSGDFVALSLSDSGTGICEDVLPRVFEPFFSTKAAGKGTGLGLSQVYGFARQSGGDVRIATTLGQGTTVTLRLPRSHSQRAPADREPPQPSPPRGTGTILLVEDNADVAQVSALLLEQLGYKIARARDPRHALEVLASCGDVSLVFTDIVMPGDMDGLALARTIRRRFPEQPVLLTTGYSNAADRAGCEFPILRKPYDIDALGMAVRIAQAGGRRNGASAG
jgi:PAS domain S-box-containing protein